MVPFKLLPQMGFLLKWTKSQPCRNICSDCLELFIFKDLLFAQGYILFAPQYIFSVIKTTLQIMLSLK